MNPHSLPLVRHWSTWDAARPAEIMHLTSMVRVTPVAYATSLGRATHFPPGRNVVYGPHAIDSSFVELTLSHAGTQLRWSYSKPEPNTALASWSATKFGEWGLRFWVALCLSSGEGGIWRYDATEHILHGSVGPAYFAVACRKSPLLVSVHDDLQALEREFEEHGYWYLGSRSSEGRFMALRFNLEEMPSNDIAIAHGGSHAEACDRARVALQAPPMPKPADDDLSAARDILAWNTVWDTRNSRPYTACSRNWDLEKFGGFGVWLTDSAISALIHSSFDEEQAWENIAALLDAQTPEGNFPCLVTGNDNWRDRSQPPLVSLIIWLIYVRTGNIKLLELAYDPLKRNHAWWWRNRDGNANGVLEYGSSAAGEGLYMGTKLAAKNESLMDNSPVHDEAQWNDKSRTLDCEDVGLNSLITLDAEMLSFMAAALGRETEAGDHRARAAAHRSKLSTHFWDDARQIFANRLWSGKFVKSLAPTSFFPMIAGAATPSQERDLLRHLTNPRTFGGRFGLPSIARNDPAFSDNVYWRGRIWPILNWLVWLGLKRNNHWAAAESLRRKSLKLFAASWRSRLAPENFNAVTGEGLDQPDTDPFYSWTALLPLMGMAGVLDIDPWKGWCLNNTGNDIELGPVNTPIGSAHISRRQGWIEVTCAGKLVVASDVKPRLTHISIADRLAVMLPAGLARGRSIRLSRPIASASQNGRKLKGLTSTHEIRLEQTGHKPELLEITFL